MARGPLSGEETRQYHKQGYTLARGMFDRTEMLLLARAAHEDKALDAHGYGRADGEGGIVRLALWNHPGEGIYGMFARCRSIVDTCERLLDGEVYHYHSKMIMKERPHRRRLGLASGLRILVRERRAVPAADQRVYRGGSRHARKRLPAGHPPVLTNSDASTTSSPAIRPAPTADASTRSSSVCRSSMLRWSPATCSSSTQPSAPLGPKSTPSNPRWSMICCYNAARNNPYKESHHPRYTPLRKVEDSAILEAGLKRFSDDPSDVAWLNPTQDVSAAGLTKEDPK